MDGCVWEKTNNYPNTNNDSNTINTNYNDTNTKTNYININTAVVLNKIILLILL